MANIEKHDNISYMADTLVIGNLEKIPSHISNDFSPIRKRSKKKFIFELVKIDGCYKYREVFSGFTTIDNCEMFDTPYIVNPVPLTSSFREYKGSKLTLLTIGNIMKDINKDNIKVFKKVTR